MVASPDSAKQFLVIFFGELKIEQERRDGGLKVASNPLNVDGSINEEAHPWIALWAKDMRTMLLLMPPPGSAALAWLEAGSERGKTMIPLSPGRTPVKTKDC